MGSQLRSRRSGEIVWLDFFNLLKDPLRIKDSIEALFRELRYPNNDLEPAGVMDQLVFLPPLFKQEQYGRFIDALRKMGYHTENEPDTIMGTPIIYTFAYDWRQDNRISARQLGIAIQKWKTNHPDAKVWVIAHSNGGIVARWFIEKEGGNNIIDKLFLLGSPWDGAPKAMQVLFEGPEVFLLRLFNHFNINKLTRETILTFPSFYQLIPFFSPFLFDQNGAAVNPFENNSWLQTDHQVQLLENAKQFYEQLGTDLNVETLCFFGIKQSTTTGGIVHFDSEGDWEKIKWKRVEPGDGTVTVHSAVHEQADEKLPYMVAHGDIYINPAVLDKLEWELRGRYSDAMVPQSTKRTQDLTVQFETNSDQYAPNETIHLLVALHNNHNDPISEAAITVRLEWAQGIPVLSEIPPLNFPFVTLPNRGDDQGNFRAALKAPEIPGYYRLFAMIETRNNDPLTIEELVLVEPQEPDWYK